MPQTVFEPNSPSESSVQRLEKAYDEVTADNKPIHAWAENYFRNHVKRLAFDLDLIDGHLAKNTSVLEIGSTPPFLTTAIHQAGHAVTGIDLAPERFQDVIDRLDLDIRPCDIERESLPVENDTFDAVLFNEVFEHLRIDLIFTTSEIHRALKPSGKLFLSTPNLRSSLGINNFLRHNLAHSCQSSIYDQYAKLKNLGHMGHVREYTVREVTDFLGRIGFRVLSVIYRGNPGGKHKIINKMFPKTRPFFSVIAEK